ncbi:family 43 glycosylhydrolase [Gracilibacillus salitolerans]|uniref:Family 43 glycosylhydrolase n=2 Tax=Gracilibacillus salitolerans TaxID=2663022 RepID=A0A5Q2TIK5_9BACI|nr:family 43 glycosylhydrolase [Gracilibacillus salitolerans]
MMKNKRVILLCMSLLLTGLTFSSSIFATEVDSADFTEEELKNNDYILYFINAGDTTPEAVESNDKMGLYASKTEQMYGVDEVTGKSWGLVTETTNSSTRDNSNKYGTLRYYNGEQTRDKAIEYNFELPEGEYEITLGFKNPWSGRSVNIISEDENLSNGDFAIGSEGEEKEVTYYQVPVTDGEMNLKIQGPAEDNLSNHNDPLVNYIIVKKYVVLPLNYLEDKIAESKVEAEKTDIYTPISLETLNDAITDAENYVDEVTENNLDVELPEVQEEIRGKVNQLDEALAGLMANTLNESFKPGQPWLDTNGAVIQAHGGGIMYDEKTETYYWYGEDKTNGYLPATGVHAYSSKDLYNWKDEGVVMKAVENREDLDEDPYFTKLYENRTAEEKDVIFSDINQERGVLERPKVIYNEETDKYVLWLHVDGPYEGSDSNYAKAKAGVAISDSPTGPFEFLESNRLNKMPEGYEYKVRNTGMSRDMTLFKDDDGTAYIIYSSEENYSLYISKLNEEYTAIAGDEYGEDFTRAIYNGHREAPAMFKYKEKYYLITSGATGWDPNPARYHVADSILGDWTDMGTPVEGEGESTTHGSQSTYVIPVDPENGKFIYMGDRWNRTDLANSRYIWLPVEFGQEDEISIDWYDEWQLDLLDKMAGVTINTELPERVLINETPNLPSTVNVTTDQGDTFDTAVEWSYDIQQFYQEGMAVVEATLPELDKVIEIKISVVPPVEVEDFGFGTDVLYYGDQYTLTTTVTNNTESQKEVKVNADVPTEWKIEPVTVQLEGLESKEVELSITPPEKADPKVFNLNVQVRYDDNLETDEFEIVAVPKAEDSVFALDAGTADSIVFGEYSRLSPEDTWDTDKGFGWIGEIPDSRDRGEVDSLRRDLIASFDPATLRISVPSGYHIVNVMSGDRQYSQANTTVTVNDEEIAETGGTDVGEFKVLSFLVNGGETGKEVELGFSGETDKHWVINALMVQEFSLESLSPLLQTYVESGELSDPIVDVLNNRLKLAEKHYTDGKTEQAVKAVEDFLKHLKKEENSKHISSIAKEKLEEFAQSIIHNIIK